MRPLAPVLLVLAILAFAGCDLLGGTDDVPDGVIYSTSFESPADTSGWTGNGAMALREEAPAGGGARSVLVSGGCVIPHSALSFVAPMDGTVALRVWAKNLAIGGGVRLRNATTDESVSLGVTEESWTRMTSETLSVDAGDQLQLWMHAGGFVASAMLVTQVAVVSAKQTEKHEK